MTHSKNNEGQIDIVSGQMPEVARVTNVAIPGVVIDGWFAGHAAPKRYEFKTEDFKRFEIANREWMGSTRASAEFGLDEEGKWCFCV